MLQVYKDIVTKVLLKVCKISERMYYSNCFSVMLKAEFYCTIMCTLEAIKNHSL